MASRLGAPARPGGGRLPVGPGRTGTNRNARRSNDSMSAVARVRPLAAGALVLGLALSGCARFGAGSEPSPSPSPTPPPDSLVLRVETGGGFVAPSFALRQVPEFTLLADGRVITQGPQITIYPGPALPNLLMRSLTPEGVQAVVDAAREAGLDGPDHAYDRQTVADAPTTTFTFVDGGRTHVISVYALDVGGAPIADAGGSDEAQARQALSEFRSKLFDLERWLPAGSVGPESSFDADEVRVYVQEPATSDPTLAQEPVDWPLDDPLATFGEPVPDQQALRCGTVTGADLDTLRPLFEQSNELTPWRSEGRSYTLILRPLLPDESGC
jgi:hypothetical protein